MYIVYIFTLLIVYITCKLCVYALHFNNGANKS